MFSMSAFVFIRSTQWY